MNKTLFFLNFIFMTFLMLGKLDNIDVFAMEQPGEREALVCQVCFHEHKDHDTPYLLPSPVRFYREMRIECLSCIKNKEKIHCQKCLCQNCVKKLNEDSIFKFSDEEKKDYIKQSLLLSPYYRAFPLIECAKCKHSCHYAVSKLRREKLRCWGKTDKWDFDKPIKIERTYEIDDDVITSGNEKWLVDHRSCVKTPYISYEKVLSGASTRPTCNVVWSTEKSYNYSYQRYETHNVRTVVYGSETQNTYKTIEVEKIKYSYTIYPQKSCECPKCLCDTCNARAEMVKRLTNFKNNNNLY